MNVGIDIVAADKFDRITEGDHERWKHVFTAAEWDHAFRDDLSSLHLAGIFAAKEAMMKATGKVGAKNYLAFEVTYTEEGAPSIEGYDCSISISHDRGLAVSVALVQ